MSEEKETKPETTETPEKPEKPKKTKVTKKSTKSKDAPKEKKKKTIKKKKTTKKVVEGAVKDKKKPTVKKAIKKADGETKKKTKKTTKPLKKTTEKKEKTKKTTTKRVHKEKADNFSKYDKMIGEAIESLSTEDKPFVSQKRIKEYLLKYMDGLYSIIPTRTRKTLEKLTEKKYLKRKKDSFAFAKLGNEKLRPDKIPKRKPIDRPVKAQPEKTEATKPPPEQVTWSGRVSRQVIRD